jgi:transcriptional regulator with XRE-family HTH domain
MPCHLPTPYPDELLYSVIARYLIHIGAKSGYSAASHIFGRATKAQVDIPSSLDAVSERTWPIWGMSGEEIVNRLTLFPYYARYMLSERVKECLKAILLYNGQGVHYRLGVNSQRIKVPRFLRFCNTCRESDLSKYGETFWRRSHQLAGVLVCPEHGDQLIDTQVPLRPRGFSNYVDATLGTSALGTSDCVSMGEGRIGEAGIVNALKIAERCREILLGPIGRWDIENTSVAYRQAAIERGFVEGAASLSQAKLESAFVSFYGETLLSRLGCGVWSGGKSNWIRDIFRAYPRTYHPVEHALVQVFLEGLAVDPSKRISFGFGPWKCSNPYTKHKERFPITKPKIYIGRNGSLVASAKCSCGFNFTFLKTIDTDPHLPIVNRTFGLGPTWETEADRLKEEGFSIRAIARKMGIDRETVRNLLNNKSAAYHVSPEQIDEWRREWTKLLESVPNRSRVLARKENGVLYQNLRRNDRDWLFAQPKSRISKPPCENRVDWASRDDEWSELLRAAAEKIRGAVPLRRLTPSFITVEAGLKSTTLANLDRLPKCRLALDKFSESLEDYRERRLRAAAAKAREMGKPLKTWVLKRLASLEGQRSSVRLNTVLEELVAEFGITDMILKSL